MKAEEHEKTRKTQALPELWQSLPNVPGVYLMKASDGTVIYVGKAIRSIFRRVDVIARTYREFADPGAFLFS